MAEKEKTDSVAHTTWMIIGLVALLFMAAVLSIVVMNLADISYR